jgi:hypothetical protein
MLKVTFSRNQVGLVFGILPVIALLQGCSGSAVPAAVQSSQSTQSTPAPSVTLSPSTASVQAWQQLQFTVSGNDADAECTWQSSQPNVLSSLGSGEFQGAVAGTAQVTVNCGSASATASVTVSAQPVSGPLVISSGGTYSGNWNSTDPSTAAVTINTNEPVVIRDSVISSRGALIQISESSTSANVTVENVTATALDPQVSGDQRGAFLLAPQVNSLVVENCSIIGASFGIKVGASSPSTLEITNNYVSNLEDRASDGQGGFLSTRPGLGHFVLLNGVSAPAGAEIAWNQIVQTIGQSSVEDVINIYNSQGSVGHPISVHDNYMEGASSPASNGDYTGNALITDGPGTNGASPTAYVQFENNQVVETAGGGVAIAAGHDVTATGNRVVSCGMTSSGTWYAWGANAVSIWNAYSNPHFYNNTITETSGGMVGPGAHLVPTAFDQWVNPPDALDAGVSAAGNEFTNPCLTSSGVNLQAENTERAYWSTKIATAGELIGDQHLN